MLRKDRSFVVFISATVILLKVSLHVNSTVYREPAIQSTEPVPRQLVVVHALLTYCNSAMI